jgi:hypothetical protein
MDASERCDDPSHGRPAELSGRTSVSTLVIGPVPVFDPELEALTGDRFIIIEDGTIVAVLDAAASVRRTR